MQKFLSNINFFDGLPRLNMYCVSGFKLIKFRIIWAFAAQGNDATTLPFRLYISSYNSSPAWPKLNINLLKPLLRLHLSVYHKRNPPEFLYKWAPNRKNSYYIRPFELIQVFNLSFLFNDIFIADSTAEFTKSWFSGTISDTFFIGVYGSSR